MREVRLLKDLPELPDDSPAKVVCMGNVIEVTTYERQPTAPPCKRIDADRYVDLRTGETCEYEHIQNRGEWKQGIRRTLAHIRALINTNVIEPKNCRWLTLTYAENMTDTKRLYKDFVIFWKRLCRWCKSNGYGKPEYISVIEPQGRGAWHAHIFLIWDSPAPYIDNNAVMEKLWGHGWTKTKAVTDCDNVGAYFSAYLADMPLEDFEQLPKDEQEKSMVGGKLVCKEFTDEQGRIKKKKFIKGGRLYLYPPNMQIIRRSKGIKEPECEMMSAGDAKKKVSSAKLTFSRSYEILSGGAGGADELGNSDGAAVGVRVNIIRKEYYNRKRK